MNPTEWTIEQREVWVGTGESVMDSYNLDVPAFDDVARITVWRLLRNGEPMVNTSGRPVNYKTRADAEFWRDTRIELGTLKGKQ